VQSLGRKSCLLIKPWDMVKPDRAVGPTGINA